MLNNIQEILKKYWGYESFLPLQREAMAAVAAGRDSVVVLPTGGGKSLCFQAPAVAMPGFAIVVSPLIALMKDQVDALTDCGVAAGRLDSSQTGMEQSAVREGLRQGRLHLLYVSPERLLTDGFLDFLRGQPVSFVAVDEAHCVSMWGHDFRPEYRQLRALKTALPGAALHAYTATATEHVRRDIAEQLGLENPEILVGSFDRPNLVYRVERRREKLAQVCEVIERHKGESGIVYCIRRKDVDEMCAALQMRGYRAAPYHAGMADGARKRNQDAFISEQADIMVATVAFGMGIDKSNVRYVVHAGAPKSLEHYQQESGRAGRDGLEAECVLLFGGDDFVTWRYILQAGEPVGQEISLAKLRSIQDYCGGVGCRHAALVGYFGQTLEKDNCQACDVCLDSLRPLDDSLVTAQKILSCVVRLGERFGGDYTASVLTGSQEQRILTNGHQTLSTYGLLKASPKGDVRAWIEQLVSQGCMAKDGEFQTLSVTPKGWRALKGQETPLLLAPEKRRPTRPTRLTSPTAADSWEGVDRGLFESLRTLRREIAEAKQLPAYIVFGDAALRDMARRRPSSREGFLQVTGVGEAKCQQYGKLFLEKIRDYCETNSLAMDVAPAGRLFGEAGWSRTGRTGQTSQTGPTAPDLLEALPTAGLPASKRQDLSLAKEMAFDLFDRGVGVDEAAATVGRARSTTGSYLQDYIERRGLIHPAPWVNDETFERVAKAAEKAGMQTLAPIFELLQGSVAYEEIRICLACLKNAKGEELGPASES
ncbi:MAG: DNA helicase RecQ [Candidatus Sumerlaeota bacterium]|nr:DNA helicase RecQ [Candidatus Sumerlaeota bacterium]